MDLRLVYVTAASAEEALRIGRLMVEERLAACANMVEPMRSIYWWQGKLEESSEALLFLKTRADLVLSLVARVRELHSYECPAIVALPIETGNPAYLNWLAAETRVA